MKILLILIVLCFGATLTSTALHGTEITVGEEWWNENLYLRFNSPSGKRFYIDSVNGIIYREKELPPGLPTELPIEATEKKLPFISFVSRELNIYDIYFDKDGTSPKMEKSQFVYAYKYSLIRPRLDTFVGPNKKVYKVIYNDGNILDIAEKSPDALNHFQIKSFGPYDKWEHTYDFSEDGKLAVDHTISPVPVQWNGSISLPQLEGKTLTDENYIKTFVKFNSPSGQEYHITTQLNIVPVIEGVKESAYITFTEPNKRTYAIHIEEKDSTPSLVELGADNNYFGNQRLYSFVTPNRNLYRIDRKNQSDNEVPVLVSSSTDSSDLQVTLVDPNRLYNKYVKYIFSDNGGKLFDRVDEIDWTPLNELPALSVKEVTANYIAENMPFLSLYTSSGNTYHVFTPATNESIALEKGAKHSSSLYISYFNNIGRRTNIYFKAGDEPYLEEDTESGNKDTVPFILLSFTTPHRKEYSLTSNIDDDGKWQASIQSPSQVKEPVDLPPVDGLSVTLQNLSDGWRFNYRFTWNGDKLVEFSSEPPKHYVDNKVLQSLIGK